MDERNFIEYIRRNKPYLYDIEMQVRRIKESTGFGDISIQISMAHKVVDRGEILATIKRQYYKRVNNQLVKIDKDEVNVQE